MDTIIETLQTPSWYKSNCIQAEVFKKAIAEGIEPKEYLNEFKEKVQKHLNISNRLAAILNNTFPPKIEELVVIASLLDMKLDDLIITEPHGS